MAYTVTPAILVNSPDSFGYYGTDTYYLCAYDDDTVILEFAQRTTPNSRYLQALRYVDGRIEPGPRYLRKSEATGAYVAVGDRTYLCTIGDIVAVVDVEEAELEAYRVDPATLEITLISSAPIPVHSRWNRPYAEGTRPVAWDATTVLLVAHNHWTAFDTAEGGKALFAHWTGTSWVFGAVAQHVTASGSAEAIGSPDFVSVEKLDAGTAVTFPATSNDYLLITGAYPSAPTITRANTSPHAWGWNPVELYPRNDGQPGCLRYVATEPGTSEPDVAGSYREHDDSYIPLTLQGGTVIEGTPVLIQPMVQPQRDIGWDMMLGSMSNGDVLATATANNATQSPVNQPGEVATWVVGGGTGQYWVNAMDAYISDWYRSAASTGRVHFGAWFTREPYGALYVQAFVLPVTTSIITGNLIATRQRFKRQR